MRKHFFFLVLFSLFIQVSQAQVSNVNRSIKILGGEAYYMHEVLAGQEIEAIAYAYAAEVPAIVKENPQIRTGLTVGEKLKIPFTVESTQRLNESTAIVTNKAQKTVKVPQKTTPKPEESSPVEVKEEKQAEVELPAEKTEPVPEQVVDEPEETPEVVDQTPQEEAEDILEHEASRFDVEEEVVTEEPVIDEPTEEPKPEEVVEEAQEQVLEQVEEEEVEPEAEVTDEPASEELPEPIKEEPIVEEASEEDELAMLQQLSQSINEGKKELEAFQEVIEETPVEEPINKAVEFSSSSDGNQTLRAFLKEQHKLQLDTQNVDSVLALREYFYVWVDQNQRIVKAQDERTTTNHNTRLLQTKDLAMLKSEYGFNANVRIPLGLHSSVARTTYKAKVKKKKIRVYKRPFFIEHLPADHPHTELIMAYATERDYRGKGDIEIVEGTQSITVHSKYEYNPFGIVDYVVDEWPLLYISSFETKKGQL